MKRLHYIQLLTLSLLFGATACSGPETEPPEESTADPIDECVFCDDGKADAFGISRESYLAYGIIELANTASERELDEEVGLDSRAARGIVARRPFFFIEEIDTVPYVGKSAFESLAAFAKDGGYVPSCGDGGLQSLIEACDDGNTVDGDGCSAMCTVEAGGGGGGGGMPPQVTTVHGVDHPSYMSLAMLDLVNAASQAELDGVVGLDSRAARGIVSQRPFADLTELDAVSYVGAAAFGKIVDYIQVNGLQGACGDNTIQSQIETCDDGNAVSGDGCSSLCVSEAGGGLVDFQESEHLIKGSDIDLNVSFIKEDTYYFRQRTIETNGLWSPELTALMTRMDGVIANEVSDGAVSYDELAIFSQSPFYEVLLPEEQRMISTIWSFYEVPVSEIFDMPRQEVPSLYRMRSHHERIGELEVYPALISEVASSAAGVQALDRTQNIQGNNLDNDKRTVEINDLDRAVGDLRPAFTQAEITEFENVREQMLSQSSPVSGALALRFDEEPITEEHLTSESFDFNDFSVYYVTDIEFLYDVYAKSRGISFEQRATSQLMVQYHYDFAEALLGEEDNEGPTYRMMRISNGSQWLDEGPGFDEGLYLFERWIDGKRSMTRLLELEAPLRTQVTQWDGLSPGAEVYNEAYDFDLQAYHILYALELSDGTPLDYHLESKPYNSQKVTYSLTSGNNDPDTTSSPQRDQWPSGYSEHLDSFRAGRYEPYKSYVLEVYKDQRGHMLSAAVFKEGSDEPCLFGLKGGESVLEGNINNPVRYQTWCEGTLVELSGLHTGKWLTLRVNNDLITSEPSGGKLVRDHSSYRAIR